jgi:crotonobetainyl-CoA:carnitine CoA-transferase CaiB-like acyl-CoA transferase
MARLPLEGVCVLERSTGFAGRLAGLLLADQGATVIIGRRDARSIPLDSFFDRGKWRNSEHDAVAGGAIDLVIRDGTDTAARPIQQIRLAITAVLPGETAYPFPDSVGDDVLKAALGFYTDLALTRRLLGEDVVYTPLALCSIYAGVLGALAAAAALADRARHGRGRDIVISRLAAGLSAIGALALEVDGMPAHLAPSALLRMPPELTVHLDDARASAERFEWLKRRMNPFVACYPTADRRLVMMFAVAHRGIARRLLETLGAWDEMAAAGLVDLSPYDLANAAFADRNIGLPENLRLSLRVKAAELMETALARDNASHWERRFGDVGVACVVVRDFEEWRRLRQTADAGLVETVAGCDWPQLGRAVRLASAQPYPPLRAARDAAPETPVPAAPPAPEALPLQAPLTGIRVLDLSNVIAGPACGRVLAELGAEVIKIDSPRPQHVPQVMAVFPGETAQGKRSLLLDVASKSGREVLRRMVAGADVVVFNKLDPALERLGLDRSTFAAINPDAIGVQLSAFKGERPSSRDDCTGYDPVLQAATGIMTRFGSGEGPELHGVASCVDYLTGYLAAFGAAVALAARVRRSGGGDWVETSLANAASLVQLSFQVSPPPVGSAECLRRTRDGWICVDPADAMADDLANSPTEDALAAARSAGVVAAPVQSIAQLKARHRDSPSATVALRTHCGAFPAVNLRPTWFQFDGALLPQTAPASLPGADGPAILDELGCGAAEIAGLIAEGVVGATLWGGAPASPFDVPPSSIGGRASPRLEHGGARRRRDDGDPPAGAPVLETAAVDDTEPHAADD